jgi:hypothetical protein
MKLILFFISLFLVTTLQAQDKNLVFKYVKTDEKKAIVGIKSVMNSSAFVLNNKTAAENYEMVYDFIAKKHEYPEDIILSATSSEEIVIQELAQGLYEMKSLGFTNSFDIRYKMTFLMRDGSIECIIGKMQLGNTAAMTKNMETEWNTLEGLYLHNKKGKPKKTMKGITDLKIENYFNSILALLRSKK